MPDILDLRLRGGDFWHIVANATHIIQELSAKLEKLYIKAEEEDTDDAWDLYDALSLFLNGPAFHIVDNDIYLTEENWKFYCFIQTLDL